MGRSRVARSGAAAAPEVARGSTAHDWPPWLARMLADGAAFDWRADLRAAELRTVKATVEGSSWDDERVRAHFRRRPFTAR